MPRWKPYEDSYAHWVTEGIVRFFEDLRYRVFHDTLWQQNERDVPLDRLYSAARESEPALLFGLQFKAPDLKGYDGSPSWEVVAPPTRKDDGRDQLRTLREPHFSRWIWYCFPYFIRPENYRQALHLSHFVCPTRICPDADRVRTMPGNFLISEPRGKCCQRLPLGSPTSADCPWDVDSELDRLSQEVRHLHGWPCGLFAPDSWGTFFAKLLWQGGPQVGRTFISKRDIERFLAESMPSQGMRDRRTVVIILERAVLIAGPHIGEDVDERDSDWPV